MGWQPLPDDVAEWMGMDTAMAEHAVELADVDENPTIEEAPAEAEQPREPDHSHA